MHSKNLGQTQKQAYDYVCPFCQHRFHTSVYETINLRDDPLLTKLLSEGALNAVSCPSCQQVSTPEVVINIHDPSRQHFALLLPENQRKQELALRIAFWQRLTSFEEEIPTYIKNAQTLIGSADLARFLDEEEDAAKTANENKRRQALQTIENNLYQKAQKLDIREAEMLAREEDFSDRQSDLARRETNLEEEQKRIRSEWEILERTREAISLLSRTVTGREAMPPAVDNFDQAETTLKGFSEENWTKTPIKLEQRAEDQIAKWQISKQPVWRYEWQGQLFLATQVNKTQLRQMQTGDPLVLLQIFDFLSGPLIVLTITPAKPDTEIKPPPTWYWTFNYESEEDIQFLARLRKNFSFNLDLYDAQYQPRATRKISRALTENVELVLKRAKQLRDRNDAEPLDYAQSIERHLAMGPQRLGIKQHNFTANSFDDLPTAGAVRLALGIVEYWSESANEDYLLLIKSFPVSYWRDIRRRVVKGAMEYGLRLGAELLNFSISEKFAVSSQQLLQHQLSAFAETSLRIKPNDLDPIQEWENWRLLLADALAAGLTIDKQLQDLARTAARRAGASPSQELFSAGDLRQVSEAELINQLTDREKRRDAVLELAERKASHRAAEIFAAVNQMTRTEVARVIPALIGLGPSLAPFFIEGLKHRQSFMRQGSALALGVMRIEAAIEPLIDMLLIEPTNVWHEAARSLGDLGVRSIAALSTSLKTSLGGDDRERIAWTLAQCALSEKGRREVMTLSSSQDLRLMRTACRALELIEHVRNHDEEVRGVSGRHRDHTVIRSFSRRFYEALKLQPREMQDEDIVDRMELLDDTDIIDEMVVLGEDDILGREKLNGLEATNVTETTLVAEIPTDKPIVEGPTVTKVVPLEPAEK